LRLVGTARASRADREKILDRPSETAEDEGEEPAVPGAKRGLAAGMKESNDGIP
jgi:hypothetical protein